MKKYNLLFILIDDLGWKDLSIYGSEFYETPNIDKLAEDGIIFTNAYASSPVCSPTRASIQTGKYPARIGITNYIGGKDRGKLKPPENLEYLPLEEKTVASYLKEFGYKTYYIGKWHLGGQPFFPDNHGYDRNIGGCGWGMPRYGYFSPYKIPTLEDGPEGEYLTDRLTEEAIKIIKETEQPFFLFLSHYAVHIPIQVPERYVEKYKEKVKKLGLDKLNLFIEGENFPCEHKKHLKVIRRIVQSDPVYAGMIENLDENIGKVINALKETGKYENTIIIFTSDNGGLSTAEGSPTCNLPLREGKGWIEQGGIRVSLIMKIPKINIKKSDFPVISTDFYPTILDILKLPQIPEQHKDGISILPALKGQNLKRSLFFHWPHYGNQGGTPSSAVIYDGWKLIYSYEYEKYLIFNLNEDIEEKNDLINKNPREFKILEEILWSYIKETKAKLPEKNG
ncbi:MAG: sulfatase [Candidatus Ratteibacteria bacterium]